MTRPRWPGAVNLRSPPGCQQRGAKIADLLIAAAAEAARLVVLHYDHDFDLIAEITGQPTEWIVAAGAVS